MSSGGKMDRNIHFWLGSESSQDERGIAAYKTVELDDQFGGSAIQYRELEGSESSLMESYFLEKGGIQYKAGGVASGFKKVDRDAYETRLLELKGKRAVRVSEVPVDASSITSGDVFILDQGMTIYVYEGSTANRAEKLKGAQVAKHIKDDERAGKAKVHRVCEDVDAATAFWAALGGEPASIPEGKCDSTVPAPPPTRIRAVGADSDEDISGGLRREVLATDKVFLLSSDGVAFIWVGKGAAIEDKKGAMDAMDAFLLDPATNTPTANVSRVSEGVESGAFKSQFLQWRDPMKKLWGEKTTKKPVTHEEVDFDRLLTNTANEDLGPDDGQGSIKVWRMENMGKVEVLESKYGQFFSGDSFVILYSYADKRDRECFIIYFWQGLETSIDEKGLSAIIANQMDEEMGGKPVQVRVVQGQEPAHFRSLFKGKMIVHKGGIPSAFMNVDEDDTTDQDGTALFQVRGTGLLNASAAQVEECATSLNSGDAFVLVKPANVMVWHGSGASDGEKETASNIANILAADYLGVGGRAVSVLEEGSETEEFWSALFGGKQVL
jgi:hypothetical protein